MKGFSLHKAFVLVFTVILFASCERVIVIVDEVPSNTPPNQPLFITGNFNNWDPGNESYQLTLNKDSTFSIELPPGFGTVEYKFTRGDWTTVETDICGYEIANRLLVIGDADTVVNSIQSWNDLDPLNCPRLTILLRDIPKDTPQEDVIAIAGNFNSWATDSTSVMQRDTTGDYLITIERSSEIEELEFKFTRGDLSTAEADEFGNIKPNRVLRFGIKDTVEVKIDGWIDRPSKSNNRVVVIIDKLPGSTPRYDRLYLASPLNSWTPGDRNYEFQRNKKGQLFFPLPRKKKMLEYKITRGSWSNVEVDKFGYEIPNRKIDMESADTVYIEIQNWKDKAYTSDYEVTFILDSLPETTPDNARFYITGNFNGWDARRGKYRFQKGPGDKYMVNLPRTSGVIEYKITRGSWDTEEVGSSGINIANRVANYGDIDSVYIQVLNWKDLPPGDIDEVTIVINSLPENTPYDDNIYLAPDFNGWNPGNPNQVFYYLSDGRPYITVPAENEVMEYKITRGNWETVEVDKNGYSITNRSITFGFVDTVYIDVARWRDFGGRY